MVIPPKHDFYHRIKVNRRCRYCKRRRKSKVGFSLFRKLSKFLRNTARSTELGRSLIKTLWGNPEINQAPVITYWEGRNQELYKIYRIISSHPRLNCAFENVSIQTFIFEQSPKNTAHYYAGLLWNWELTTENNTWDNHLHFVQRCIHNCIKYMEKKDFQILKEHLEHFHQEYFPELIILTDTNNIKCYLWTIVTRSENILHIMVEAINHWFLCKPILLELAKHTSWNFLHTNRASLLGMDVLYGILLNMSYNRKPYHLQKSYY